MHPASAPHDRARGRAASRRGHHGWSFGIVISRCRPWGRRR